MFCFFAGFWNNCPRGGVLARFFCPRGGCFALSLCPGGGEFALSKNFPGGMVRLGIDWYINLGWLLTFATMYIFKTLRYLSVCGLNAVTAKTTVKADLSKVRLIVHSVRRKPQNFSFVLSNAVVETVRVRINVIPFIFFKADVRSFEIRITAWRKRNQNWWHSFLRFSVDCIILSVLVRPFQKCYCEILGTSEKSRTKMFNFGMLLLWLLAEYAQVTWLLSDFTACFQLIPDHRIPRKGVIVHRLFSSICLLQIPKFSSSFGEHILQRERSPPKYVNVRSDIW